MDEQVTTLHRVDAGPRGNRESSVVASKRERLREPHVAPLTTFVETMRAETGGDVPWFDPDTGGIHARALLLLEAPGRRATEKKGASVGSGFICLDNDDPTAEALWHLVREAELPRGALVIWNIVPWYIGSASRIRAPEVDDLVQATPYLKRLLSLLPRLESILTIGRKAEAGWAHYQSVEGEARYRTLACPHPSPRNLRTRPAARGEILAALIRLRNTLGR